MSKLKKLFKIGMLKKNSMGLGRPRESFHKTNIRVCYSFKESMEKESIFTLKLFEPSCFKTLPFLITLASKGTQGIH